MCNLVQVKLNTKEVECYRNTITEAEYILAIKGGKVSIYEGSDIGVEHTKERLGAFNSKDEALTFISNRIPHYGGPVEPSVRKPLKPFNERFLTIKNVEDFPALPPTPIAVDIETTSLKRDAIIVGASICFDSRMSYFIPIRMSGECYPLEALIERLNGHHLIFWNLKFDHPKLERHGLKAGKVEDAMIYYWATGVHIVDTNASLALKDAAHHLTGRKYRSYDDLGLHPSVTVSIPPDFKEFDRYAALDARMTFDIHQWAKTCLKQPQSVIDNEHAILPALIDMEDKGLRYDLEKEQDVVEYTTAKKKELDKAFMAEMKRVAPTHPDPKKKLRTTTPCLRELLDHLDVPVLEWTKAAKTRTSTKPFVPQRKMDKENREKYIERGYFPDLVQACHSFEEAKNSLTVLASYNEHIRRDGTIPANLISLSQRTGRFSSSKPNIQNLKAHFTEAEKKAGVFRHRELFLPDEDHYFLEMDYSSQELILMIYVANDTRALEYMESGRDLHSRFARVIYPQHADKDDKWFKRDEKGKELRQNAKRINFAILYGALKYQVQHLLALDTPEEGEEVRRKWRKLYPNVNRHFELAQKIGNAGRGVQNPFGLISWRPKYIREDKRKSFYSAFNFIIQSSGASMLKRAIPKVYDILKDKPARLCASIHDSLLFCVHKDMSVEDLVKIVAPIMEEPVPILGCSIGAEVKIGKVGEPLSELKEI